MPKYKVTAPDGSSFFVNAPEGATQEQALEYARSQWKGMDRRSGAPASVRAVVGPSSRKPEDRLSTLQRFYPDAQMYGEENFVFSEGGMPRLYNPAGMDVGDVAEYGRIFPEGFGGAVGGALGAMASTPTGFTSAPVMVPLGVGIGAATGGQAYDTLMESFMGRQDTRGVPERAVGAVTDITLNAAGQKLVPAVESGVKRLIGAARNRMAGQTPPQLVNAYTRAGVPVEGANPFINASRPVQGLSEALVQLPTSSRTMTDAIDLTMDAISRYADDVATATGGRAVTAQEVGDTIQAGARAAGRRLRLRSDDLQNAVWDAVGRDTPVSPDAVAGLVADMEAQLARAPQSMSYLKPAIEQGRLILTDAAETGAVPFDVLRRFRTHIGDLTQRSDVTGYVGGTGAEINRLYGALSDDLNRAAELAGPNAKQALDVYNRYMRWNLNINKPLLDKLDKVADPEKIFGNLFNAGKRGATELRRLRNNLTPDEWDEFLSGVVHNLGRATPGRNNAAGDLFSPGTFLTNWNRLSPEAKSAMFSGKRYGALRGELDRLVKIVGSAKDAEKMKNMSGTAQQNFYMLLAQGSLPVGAFFTGGADAAMAAGAVSFGAPYAMSKLMTNPRFVRWLARGTRISPTNYNSLKAHMGRLALLAKYEPDIKDEISQFLAGVREYAPTEQEAAN